MGLEEEEDKAARLRLLACSEGLNLMSDIMAKRGEVDEGCYLV